MKSPHWLGLDWWYPDPVFKWISKCVFRGTSKNCLTDGILHQRYILQHGCEALDLREIELWRVDGPLHVHCARAGHGQGATHSTILWNPETFHFGWTWLREWSHSEDNWHQNITASFSSMRSLNVLDDYYHKRSSADRCIIATVWVYSLIFLDVGN